MSPAVEPESVTLARLLFHLAGELGRLLLDGGVLPRRLTRQQVRILLYLREASGGMMLTDLTRITGVTQGTTTVALQRMEAAGLVRRERAPDDARALRLRLSRAGARLANATARRMVKAAGALCAGLGPRQRVRLRDSAGCLLDAIRALHGRRVYRHRSPNEVEMP